MATINALGSVYNWGSVALNLFGSPVIGITKIEYASSQKKDNHYGLGRDVIGRGYGNIEYTASMELLIDEWRKIIQNAPTGDPLQIAPFNIDVTYVKNTGTVTDRLYSCEFTDNNFSASQGDTQLKVTVKLIISGLEQFV